MRYAQIRKTDISNGSGIGVSLFVQGCSRRCKGCFNPETWDFEGGKPFTQETLETIIALLNKPYITRFSILGGEPLEKQNYSTLANIIKEVRKIEPEPEIWIWTSKTYDELLSEVYEEKDPDLTYILQSVHKLIDGPFIEEEKDFTLKWRGSRNQKVISPRTMFSLV